MNLITSVANTKIKQIVKLANSRAYRYELGLAVIYGQHLVEEAIKHKLLDAVFINQANIGDYEFVLQNVDSDKVYLVNDDVQAKINVSESVTDIVGLIRIKSAIANDSTIYERDCVILENIQDPGNLGTILRSCAACGIDNIIISKSCVDPYNVKVLRASQGVQFELNLITMDLVGFISEYKHKVIATVPNAKNSIYVQDLKKPCAWIFGNEGAGISSLLLDHVTHHLSIPMPGKTESLNVAMASTICLFEMLRQRTTN